METRRETEGGRRRRLLGPLAAVLRNEKFRDDVVVSADLLINTRALAERLVDPRWVTVESLDLRWRSAAWFAGRSGAFFNSRPALRAIEGLSAKLLPEVPCPRILRLSVARLPLARIVECFPALRSLELETPFEEALGFWSDPLVRALESVTITTRDRWRLTWQEGALRVDETGYGFDRVIRWIDEGPALTAIQLGTEVKVREWSVGDLKQVIAAAQRRGAVDIPDLRYRCERCGAPCDWDAPARERPLLGWGEDDREFEQEDEPRAPWGDRSFA